jgi:hypothetical protein
MGLNDVNRPFPVGQVAKKTILSASETLFDITGADTGGRVLVPCKEITIQSRSNPVMFAEEPGEIAAGRYLTIISSLTLNGVRGGKFYMQAVGGNADVEVYAK